MNVKTPIPNTSLYDHQQILFVFDDSCENVDFCIIFIKQNNKIKLITTFNTPIIKRTGRN